MRTTAFLWVMLMMCPAILWGSHHSMVLQQVAMKHIPEATIQQVAGALVAQHGEAVRARAERGVRQAAALWYAEDGTAEEFATFCKAQFVGDESERRALFGRLMTNFEILSGNMLRIKKDLMRPLHLDMGPILAVDRMFGSYEPGAHMRDDFFNNKIAFMVILNFPFYSLDEKIKYGPEWSRLEWAYARVGDYYTSRLPAALVQETSSARTNAGNYIAEYNIYMGRLITPGRRGEALFPEELRLITHWGLRDELKSNYAVKNGLDKQRMIYAVMKRIIDQSIPAEVINNKTYQWNPFDNILLSEGKSVPFTSEPDTRYQHLLNNFRANVQADPYYPAHPTFIQRQFESGMEMTQEEVRELFTGFISSPQVQQVAALISKRLGRKLEPFDIWYNGFRADGSRTEEELDMIVRELYPTAEAFQNDLAPILMRLGFPADRARFFAEHTLVEGSRGAGHAYGSLIRTDKVLLRSRVGATGMDYKGYNIAMHEFGHNVEQVITLHDVDHYSLNRVPNTAFTEALAFMFQKRDLEVLGLAEEDPLKEHMSTLANFWSCYEIMGVSLVDMRVWEWMYANPDATPAQLKEAVIAIAKEIWNLYYAPVFGSRDEPILAIYSHMISNPLYLSNYPLGRVIDFQIEQHIRGKDFAAEVQRMFELGRLIPREWMRQAVGSEISVQPMLEATDLALKAVRK
jgi:hypothetical protein